MTIREQLYKIIFETDTKAGKQFDVFLLWIILLSVLVVMIESVPEMGNQEAKNCDTHVLYCWQRCK